MENLATALLESASAVAVLGGSQAEIDALDDASAVAGMKLVARHEQHLHALKLAYATTITRRSSSELGYAGLARRSGAATPQILIQNLTGSSTAEAAKLAQLGAMVIEVEDGVRDTPDSAPTVSSPPVSSPPWQSPIVEAVALGHLSLDSADAIRRGLGVVDAAISSEQLRSAARRLVDQALVGRNAAGAGAATPEKLWRAARDLRNELDSAAVERGEKERADQRYVRRFRRDGMFGGSWLLPEEEGGRELDQALALMLSSRTGGPRFPEAAAGSNSEAEQREKKRVEDLLRDTRTNEQVLADGFVQVFRNGLGADATVLPGKGRAAVRVIVTQEVLDSRAGNGTIEGSTTPIALGKVEQALCDTGMVGIMFDSDGQIVNIGRELRLFSARQRIGLAVRDGGCRAPGCEKPPSWCEAHHIDYWARDKGRTDIADGILLCRFHHMLFHNNGWEIVRDRGTYWLKPPRGIDPEQIRVNMPPKNAAIAAINGGEP